MYTPIYSILRTPLARGIILYLACTVATYISFQLFTAPAVFSLQAGIGLAGLMLLGKRYWVAIFAATYTMYLINDAPFLFVAFFALGHTLQALAGVYLLERFEYNRMLARLRDALVFMGVALVVSAIAPTLGFLGIYLSNAVTVVDMQTTLTWGYWWTGMTLSLLVITPFITRWLKWPHPRRNYELLENVGAYSAIVLVSSILFLTNTTSIGAVSLVYFLLMPLIWIALRLGPRHMTLALFTISCFAVMGTFVNADVTQSTHELGERLFQVEVFLIIISLIFLLLVSTEEERKETNKKMHVNVRELKLALDRLYTQDRTKNNFLAMLAHELRNPLAPVVSHLELMKLKGQVSPEGTVSLTVIEQRLETVKRLLDDLLDISRISENKIVIKEERLDLRDVITAAVHNVSSAAAAQKQDLLVRLPDEGLPVMGDSVRLEQIFSNLLFNATKFTHQHGQIEIRAEHAEGSVVVRVKDNGQGIDAYTLPRIFDTFYQGKSSLAGAASGLGIGLALTNHLVRMHGGTIEAKSEGENKGSEFIVTLPDVDVPHTTTSETEETLMEQEPQDQSTRILVVDDNREAANGVALLLTAAGYTTECVFSGTEALTKVVTLKPEAIFLDIGLPDMSGYDVARTLRNEHHYAGKIIALSGYGQDEDKRKSEGAGFTHHLTKPVRLADLLSALKEDPGGDDTAQKLSW